MGTLLEQDKYRYAVEKMPRFQRLFRCCQECRFKPMQLVYRLLFRWCRQRNFIELSHQTVIGGGLYIGHPYCITINPQAVIGPECQYPSRGCYWPGESWKEKRCSNAW